MANSLCVLSVLGVDVGTSSPRYSLFVCFVPKIRGVKFSFRLSVVAVVLATTAGSAVRAQAPAPAPHSAEHHEFVIDNFHTESGATLPKARIVYGTCSVLRDENEGVVEKFLAQTPGFTLEEQLRVWPHKLEGGGFFGARLRKG